MIRRENWEYEILIAREYPRPRSPLVLNMNNIFDPEEMEKLSSCFTDEKIILPDEEISTLIMGKTIEEATLALPKYYHIHNLNKYPGMLYIFCRTRIAVKLEDDKIVSFSVG
jgi:hypothetical protein